MIAADIRLGRYGEKTLIQTIEDDDENEYEPIEP
jgi:hypothetical protein